MSRIFIIVMFFTALFFSANAVNFKLKNGKRYDGEIITENSLSYTIKIGNTPVTVLKNIIVEIDGKPTEPTQNESASANSDTLKVDYQGKKLSVTLKNGMVFQGTMIKDNGKIVVLNRDGSPVNIYRSTIVRIDIIGMPSETTYETTSTDSVSNEPKNSDALSQQDTPITKDAVVSVQQFDTNDDHSGSSIEPTSSASPSLLSTPKDSSREILQSSGISREENKVVEQLLSPIEVSSFNESSERQPVKTGEKMIPPALSGVKIPESNVYIPPARSINDGKKEIVLKNGSVFLGKILSENDRFISFDSDGASMNILKKLIKEIDGTAYEKAPASPKKEVSKIQNDSLYYKHKVAFTGKRLFPVVDIPSGTTVAQIIDSLKSSVWENRSRACRMLGAMGQWAYSSVNYCAVLLTDTAQIRGSAPVWIDSADIQRLLAPSLEAARALAYLGDEGYRILREALSSPDVLVRRSAVFGLLEFSDNVSKGEILVQMLKDKEPSIRALALGAFCTPQGEHHLLAALNDFESQVRSSAALLLGKLKSEKAIPQLQELLNDNRSVVRAYAIEALGQIEQVQVTNKMLSLLEDPNFMVREKTVTALGYLQDTTAIWPLINSLRDANADVRAAAATALSYIRDPRAIPSLYSLLKDENLVVREHARESLRLHTELGQLIEALTDANNTVRDNAAYVLWLLTGKDYGSDPKRWLTWYQQESVKKN